MTVKQKCREKQRPRLNCGIRPLRSLCDCQSDLEEVKCIESSRIHLAKEKLEEDLRACRTELQMITHQVEVPKAEFKNLEKDTTYDSNRSHTK